MGCANSRALTVDGGEGAGGGLGRATTAPPPPPPASKLRLRQLGGPPAAPGASSSTGGGDGGGSGADGRTSSTDGAGSTSSDGGGSGKAADTFVALALRSKRRARGGVILGDYGGGGGDDLAVGDGGGSGGGDQHGQPPLAAQQRAPAPKSPDTRAMLLRALRGNVLFGAYAPRELDALVDALDRRTTLPPGSTVIRQGDPGDNFYVIERGRVRAGAGCGGCYGCGFGKRATAAACDIGCCLLLFCPPNPLCCFSLSHTRAALLAV
jgi:hypothetical protein